MKRPWLAAWVVVALLGFCGLAPSSAEAQDLADDRFALLGARDGLDGRVLDIAQDPQGFLWFAMPTGLHRYDGSRVTSYRHDPADPHSISDNHVRRLLVDSQGTLWLAVDSGRLDQWLPEEERFRRLPVELASTPVDLVESSPGEVLVTLHGPDVVRVTTGETAEVVPGLDSVDCIVVDAARQSVWGFGSRGLTQHRQGDFVEEERFPWPPSFDSESSRDQVLGCTLARDGSVWGAAYTAGAVRFDSESQELTVFRHAAGDRWTLTGNDLTSVREDSQGRVWIAGFSGLNRLVPGRESFEHFVFDPTRRQGLVNHQIHAVFEDRSGQIWLGTDTGAARFDPLRETFRFYSHGPNRQVSAPAGSIRSFTEDEAGRIWVGSRNHGIARIDREAGETLELVAGPEGGGLPDGTAWTLFYETPGRLWVGGETGVSRLEVDTGTWRTYPVEIADGRSRVVILFGDRLGSLWAAGDEDLHRYDREADAFLRIELGVSSRVLSMTDDATGRLFVGTDGDGLLVLNARTGEPWSDSGEGSAWEWPQGQIAALVTVPGSPETVWAGTLSQGLFRLEPDGSWSRFGAAQGLPSETVQALLADAEGRLWLSTGLETLRFDPSTSEVLPFQSTDGLPSLVHPRASFKTRNGELLFGGLDGFVAFFPDSIRVDTTPPPVVLTDFRIGNRSMRPRVRQDDSPLAKSITHAEQVTLDHRQNDFTIELAALHFGDSERNRFAYRLDGVDIDWIEVPAERSFARYSGIPAGRYTFRAKAANRDGVWSEDEAQLEVRVLPAPWRSGWAWALYAAALIGLVAWWLRTRIVRLELEKELQEKELKILRGLLPICASCKKIRDDEGEWEPIETYLDSHSEAQLSHGICPQCAEAFYGFTVGAAETVSRDAG